jgi:putative ubiquitin-RnfH superfamily antitoxin RatB of RatAB toxin-antitoxin module
MKYTLLSITLFFHFISSAQTEILLEDFQNGFPTGWTSYVNDSNTPVDATFENGWVVVADPENETDSIIGSTSYFTPEGTAHRWLITPQITLGAYGNFLDWNAKSHDPSFSDDYLVLVSTTDNQLASFTDTIGSIQQENFEWTNRLVDLSLKGYDNQQIYVAFINTTNDGFKLYLDSIHVVKEDPVGIDFNELEVFKVYPNPASNQLTISTEREIQEITIVNSIGQSVINTTNKNINIESLEIGIYYIQLISEDKLHIQKFIKE